MGHIMSRQSRPARRLGSATGQVPFSPLWQPRRLLLRVRRHGVVTLEQSSAYRATSVHIRSVKRIFRTSTFTQL